MTTLRAISQVFQSLFVSVKNESTLSDFTDFFPERRRWILFFVGTNSSMCTTAVGLQLSVYCTYDLHSTIATAAAAAPT